MKKYTSLFLPVLWGILLITLGTLLLLSNFNIITMDWSLAIGPAFAIGGLAFLAVYLLDRIGGLAFLAVYLLDRNNWWALIPGLVLIALGAIIFLEQVSENAADHWGGAIFLGAIGLSFWLIYLTKTSNWWAIIPAGVLSSLAVVTLVPENWLVSGSIFFIGLALTFAFVYILPKPEGRMKWALYPAAGLLLVGILATLGATNWLGFIWPSALLIGGGFLIYRAIRKH